MPSTSHMVKSIIMKTANRIKIVTIASVLIFTLASCQKNWDALINSAEDNALAELTFNDVNQIADEAANGNLSSYKSDDASSGLGPCAFITNDSTSTPRMLTIDFGSVNCLSMDGRNRRGKIIVSYTGKYRDAGSSATYSFDNYFVNDNQILGSKTLTNMGTNTAGNIWYDISVSASIVKADGSGTITWNSDREREWIAGYSTPARGDDEYRITGSASGVSASGDSYSASITSPLHRSLACRFIDSGVIDITVGSFSTRTINFGSGTCDNTAELTVDGRTRTINLR